MDRQNKLLHITLILALCGVIFRLLGLFPGEKLVAFFSRKEVMATMIFLETGRILRTEPLTETQPSASKEESPAALQFQPEDASLVEVSAICEYPLELEQLLTEPLSWDLRQQAPTVLILHTHATEAYTPQADQTYTPSSPYRTLDTGYNTVRIGQLLAQLLRAGGVQVIHDTTLHDYPDYNGSYTLARKTISRYLEENPSITMVIDIHRDASDLTSKQQLTTHAQVYGKDSSQLMMVVGTDAGGRNHPNWQENMALAVKLHTRLEQISPGICRPISFRTQRFNQDLSPGAMLIEVGAAGDSLEQALTATRVLAQGILDLASGTTTDATS